jgi:hypothetical protein
MRIGVPLPSAHFCATKGFTVSEVLTIAGLYCCEHRHFRPGEPGSAAAAPNIGRAPKDRSYNASAH